MPPKFYERGFMSFLTEFINEVRKGEPSFEVSEGGFGVFSRMRHGKAEFIVGDVGYGSKLNIEIDTKMAIFAIVHDGEVIIMDNYHFDTYKWRCSGHLEHVEGMNDVTFLDWKLKSVNSAITEFFNEWYATLPVEDYVLTRSDIELLKKRELGMVAKDTEAQRWIGTKELIAFLDGEIPDIFSYVKEYTLEKNRDSYIKYKSCEAAEREYLQSGHICEWERKLGEILKRACSEGVRFLNVSFERNGLCAAGKVDPNSIFRALTSNDYFGEFTFNTRPEGKRVYRELAIAGHGNELRFGDISDISYKREVLWSRKEAC